VCLLGVEVGSLAAAAPQATDDRLYIMNMILLDGKDHFEARRTTLSTHSVVEEVELKEWRHSTRLASGSKCGENVSVARQRRFKTQLFLDSSDAEI